MPNAPVPPAQGAEIAALARSAERAATQALAASRLRVSGLERDLDAFVDQAAQRRLLLSACKWIPPAWPFRGRITEKLRKNESSRDAARSDLAAARLALKEAETALGSLRSGIARLARARTASGKLGPPPPGTAREIAALALAARAVRLRAGRGDVAPADALPLFTSFHDAIAAWARQAAIEAAAAARPAAPSVARSRASDRIYLPVPQTLWDVAGRAGALRDPDAPRGSSPWFVRPDMDMRPFRSLLPLGARPGGAGLSFPPIPPRAAGQNLWGLFDPGTWDHVRKSAYAASGRRCAICGGRSEGFLAERLHADAERRHPIECHEVWDWRVHPNRPEIGIQVLRQMLVVCRNCHPMFHEGFFLARARQAGLEAETSEAIRKRRMIVNRLDAQGLEAALAAAATEKALTGAVEHWVVDLRQLAAQTYMDHRVPVLADSNRSGTAPEAIAGIAFETSDGRIVPARRAADACKALVASLRSHTGPRIR